MTRPYPWDLAQAGATNGQAVVWNNAVGRWEPGTAANSGADAEFIRDTIGAALVQGTGVVVTVNDAGDTITIAVDTATEYERMLDFLSGTTTAGQGLVQGSGITLAYDDANNKITVATTGAGVPLTIQDENANVTTDVAQIDFQGAGVAATAGTGEVVVTIPGYTDEQARDAIGAALVQGANITITVNDAGDTITIASTGGSGGHTVEDETTALTQRTKLSFQGSGVTATDESANDRTVVTIPGGDSRHVVQDEGASLTNRATLNFVGAGVTVTDDATNAKTVVTIPGAGTSLHCASSANAAAAGDSLLTLAATPYEESLQVFKNGLLLRSGSANDYTISGLTVSFTSALAAGDVISDYYWTTTNAPGDSALSGSTYPPVKFKDPFTSGTPVGWTTASGGSSATGRNGNGRLLDSATHLVKTFTATAEKSDTYTAGVAVTSTGNYTADTDSDDFGLLAFCGDSGATCHLQLVWVSNALELRRGRGGTVLATSATAMTSNAWHYVTMKAVLHDTAGSVVVVQDGVTVISVSNVDTRNGGTDPQFDTLKIGGFWPSNFPIDDVYVAVGAGTVRPDPGDVTNLLLG